MPTQILDNGIYKIFIEDGAGNSIGTFTMETGANHPAGPGRRLLSENYNTIRSYSSLTDYVQTSYNIQTTDPGYKVMSISSAAAPLPQTPTNSTIVYNLTGSSYPDNMTVVQYITIYGTNINDSRVAITTSITNTGTDLLGVGVRYFWDLRIGDDDGPTFQTLNPNGPVLITEATYVLPDFEDYQLENNQGSPTIQLKGTVKGPSTITPPPVAPDKLEYAFWGDAVNRSFSYATKGTNIDGDSSLLTFWGNDPENKIELLPGETATVRTLLFNNVQESSRGVHFGKLA